MDERDLVQSLNPVAIDYFHRSKPLWKALVRETCHARFSSTKRRYQLRHDDINTEHAGTILRMSILGHEKHLMHLNMSASTNDGSKHYSTTILIPICSDAIPRMWLPRVSARLLPISLEEENFGIFRFLLD